MHGDFFYLQATHATSEPRVRRARPRHVRLSAVLAALIFSLSVALGGCADAGPQRLRVFAAASLQELAADLTMLFEESYGVATEINVAGSHILARQIARAPAAADIFLSADPDLVQQLIADGHVLLESRRDPWRNTLVIAARRDAAITLTSAADLATADFDHLAIGDPDGVPAGRYGRLALEQLDLWQRLSPRLVPMPDVRAALALAAADPRTLAIVYRTDVAILRQDLHTLTSLESPMPIIYSAGATAAGQRQLAEQFLNLLDSDEARQLATSRGFGVALR